MLHLKRGQQYRFQFFARSGGFRQYLLPISSIGFTSNVRPKHLPNAGFRTEK